MAKGFPESLAHPSTACVEGSTQHDLHALKCPNGITCAGLCTPFERATPQYILLMWALHIRLLAVHGLQ
eukprot:scaffold256688_cov18-Tisochrysis_lutea.AAC.1